MSRILIVDDDLTYLSYVEEELTQRGFEVTTAMDGQEAIALVESKRPDVIVLDISMPLVSGVSLLRSIRKSHPSVIVILHSSHSEYEHSFETWSANAFVEKSTDLSRLFDVIRRHVRLQECEEMNLSETQHR